MHAQTNPALAWIQLQSESSDNEWSSFQRYINKHIICVHGYNQQAVTTNDCYFQDANTNRSYACMDTTTISKELQRVTFISNVHKQIDPPRACVQSARCYNGWHLFQRYINKMLYPSRAFVQLARNYNELMLFPRYTHKQNLRLHGCNYNTQVVTTGDSYVKGT